MTRPKKKREIHSEYKVLKFSPRGIVGRPDISNIAIDELEAVRLADYEDMKHIEAARMMNISRQTFERILKGARRKIADGIVNGKIVNIKGIS